jgi:hypothetical protein
MPNWCSNNIVVTHAKPEKLQEFVDAYNNGAVCEHFMPQPKDLDSEDCFGPNGWYTWRCNNWGVKWDFGKEEHDSRAKIVNDEVSISFSTAWSPPIELYHHLQDEGYEIKATYWEPGMAFCGWYKDGEENTIEYTCNDEIPIGLWDEYNMEEVLEETEADA